MNEVDRDFEFYLPYHSPIKRLGKGTPNSAVQRFGRGMFEELYKKASDTFSSQVQSLYGPLYSIDDSQSAIPPDWRDLIMLLHQHQAIPQPTVYIDPPFNDEPKMTIVSIPRAVDKERFFREKTSEVVSFGGSFNVDVAFSKAIGEFLERYTLLHWKQYPTIKGSQKELERKGYQVLDIESLAGISQKQRQRYAHWRFDEESVLFWVQGKNISSRKTVLLPAQLVFWDYAKMPHEAHINESNTNGAGGMFSEQEAILSGLRELIQRDAFLLFWLNGVAPGRLALDTLPPEVKTVVDTLHRYHFGLEILDITTDITLPTFVAVLIDQGINGGGIVVGAGCEGSATRAILHAIEEALLVYHVNRRRALSYALPKQYDSFITPIGHLQRVALWANPAMFSQFTWFIEGKKFSFSQVCKKFTLLSTPLEELAFLKKTFASLGKGYEIFYYPVKNTLLEVFNYHVSKVIVPSLLPLYLHETNASLQGERLHSVLTKLGYPKGKFPNPLPHPFP